MNVSTADLPTTSLRRDGYVILTAEQLAMTLDIQLQQLDALQTSWSELPRDAYLRDGGRYRSRRHSCFIQNAPGDVSGGELQQVAHRAHWQPTDYNALHGGMERWFEPIDANVTHSAAWQQLIIRLGHVFATDVPAARWFIEAHQFRIDTSDGIGRPTPEGAHRDGVDFVAVILVGRHDVRGGETRVFQAEGMQGVRFTMTEPWTVLLLDDARVIHETTPIQPAIDVEPQAPSHRDTLVLTYRRAGFQAPD